MNDFEQRLRSLPLVPPSPELDRRVEAFLAEPDPAPRGAARLPRWSWYLGSAVALGGAAAVVLLALLTPPVAPPLPTAVLVQVEPRGQLRNLLLEAPSTRPPRPHVLVRVGQP